MTTEGLLSEIVMVQHAVGMGLERAPDNKILHDFSIALEIMYSAVQIVEFGRKVVESTRGTDGVEMAPTRASVDDLSTYIKKLDDMLNTKGGIRRGW